MRYESRAISKDKITPRKILAIDYGLKRIGLATTDPSGTIASPLTTIPNRGDRKNITARTNIITEQGVGLVVMGLPLYKDGNETEMAREVRRFAASLRQKIDVDVVFHNEIGTSREAEDHIRNTLGIKSPSKIKELVDKMAAYMILSSYLEESKNEQT